MIYSKAIGKIISKTVAVLSFSTTATFSKASGLTISPKAVAASITKMATISSDNMKTAIEKASGLIFLPQNKKSKANGKAIMIVLGSSFILMVKSMKGSC